MLHPEILLGMRPSNCNRRSGCVAETIVTAELLKRDWVVSTPEGDYAPYDKIATKNKFIKKIQVKSSNTQKGSTYRYAYGKIKIMTDPFLIVTPCKINHIK